MNALEKYAAKKTLIEKLAGIPALVRGAKTLVSGGRRLFKRLRGGPPEPPKVPQRTGGIGITGARSRLAALKSAGKSPVPPGVDSGKALKALRAPNTPKIPRDPNMPYARGLNERLGPLKATRSLPKNIGDVVRYPRDMRQIRAGEVKRPWFNMGDAPLSKGEIEHIGKPVKIDMARPGEVAKKMRAAWKSNPNAINVDAGSGGKKSLRYINVSPNTLEGRKLMAYRKASRDNALYNIERGLRVPAGAAGVGALANKLRKRQ